MDNIEKIARKLCEIRGLDPDANISVLEPVASCRGSTLVGSYADLNNVVIGNSMIDQWRALVPDIMRELDRQEISKAINEVLGENNEN